MAQERSHHDKEEERPRWKHGDVCVSRCMRGHVVCGDVVLAMWTHECTYHDNFDCDSRCRCYNVGKWFMMMVVSIFLCIVLTTADKYHLLCRPFIWHTLSIVTHTHTYTCTHTHAYVHTHIHMHAHKTFNGTSLRLPKKANQSSHLNVWQYNELLTLWLFWLHREKANAVNSYSPLSTPDTPQTAQCLVLLQACHVLTLATNRPEKATFRFTMSDIHTAPEILLLNVGS